MGKSKQPTETAAKDNKSSAQPVPVRNIRKFIKALADMRKKRAGAIIMLLYQFADNGKMSGRRDGNVLMRNGRGRGMTVPALVQNAYTTLIRVLLSTLSSTWEILTDAERDSWNNMSWYSTSNRFGIAHVVKGKNAYVALNANIALVGGTPVNSAPADSGGVPSITDADITATLTSGTIEIAYSPSPTAGNTVHMVEATKILPAGVSKPQRSDFRLIGFIAGGVATPADITADYEAKYGASWQTVLANTGKKIFVRLKPVNEDTGAPGAGLVGFATIVP